MEKIAKIILIVAITVGSVLLGYRFLSIRTDVLLGQKPVNTDPVITMETLPEGEEGAAPDASMELAELVNTINSVPPPEPRQPSLAEIRLSVIERIQANGSEIVDSRAFEDKATCDQAVLTVVSEYRKRGIREQDSTETSPFPNSAGIVWMLNNGGRLNYLGCVAPPDQPWGVYVHFIPNG